MSSRQREPVRLLSDDRGAVTVEYAVLLAVVAVGCALAIAGLGSSLFATYVAHRTWLLLPMP